MHAAPPKIHCVIHPERDAAARCAGCGENFCRECVTEHELQMLCAACFRELTREDEAPTKRMIWLTPLALSLQLFIGIVLVWVSFYLVGRLVIAVPSDFHEGTLWQEIEMGGAE